MIKLIAGLVLFVFSLSVGCFLACGVIRTLEKIDSCQRIEQIEYPLIKNVRYSWRITYKGLESKHKGPHTICECTTPLIRPGYMSYISNESEEKQ